MIGFKNSTVFTLKSIDSADADDDFHRFLIDGEENFATFKITRGQWVFTSQRIISR